MTQRVINGLLADCMRRAGITPAVARRLAEGRWVADEPVKLEEKADG